MSATAHSLVIDSTAPVGVIEYVTFPALETTSDAELLAALRASDAVLNTIDGFIRRCFSRQDDGLWAETVFWRDRDAAEAGLSVFLNDPRSRALLDLIDGENVEIRYSEVLADTQMA
ncbi:Uncharacterised protein [BD1-7 clade bacterium]|uniref:ABM domain-containing protein n=1 Tax=BD1-7 clade bacterium TaxID=2029982 RepID=A0A5S9PB48_9GAMM|nr:Uncharacterised protein [BD1-7 clade bacterium]